MKAIDLLGLPDPNALTTADPAFAAEYRAFLDALQVAPDERVVLVDPYQLSVPTDGIQQSATTWFSSLTERERAKLLVLSILTRSFDASCLWPADQPRFSEAGVVSQFFADENQHSLSEHDAAIPFGLDTIQGRHLLKTEPALAELVRALPRSEPIETISSEFIGGQPGNYGYQMWQVCRWSKDWAVIYGVTDAARDAGYPFPWLLGFCHKANLERNFVALLREASSRFDRGFYYTYGQVLTSWPLAELAVKSDDDSEGPDWETLNWLLMLDDHSMQRVFNGIEGEFDALDLLRRLRTLRDDMENIGLGSLGPKDLLVKANAGDSLAKLEARVPEWTTAYEEGERKASEERKRLIGQFDEAIATVMSRANHLSSGNKYETEQRQKIVRHYIEDHIVRHGSMPAGTHDFGTVLVRSSFHASHVRVGVIDFDSTG